MTKEQLVVEALDGYTPEVGRLIWMLEATRVRLKEAVDGISLASLDWQPPDGGNRIGTLLYHIAIIEADWLYEEALAIDWPQEITDLCAYGYRDDDGRLSLVEGESLADHLARLDQIRAKVLDGFRHMDVKTFRQPRHFDPYDVTPEWVLFHLINHESEHCGQIMDLRTRSEQALFDQIANE